MTRLNWLLLPSKAGDSLRDSAAGSDRAQQDQGGEMKPRTLRLLEKKSAPAVLVNANESRSVVGSDNNIIASAISILFGVIGEHPGRLTYTQARDVIAWAGTNSERTV